MNKSVFILFAIILVLCGILAAIYFDSLPADAPDIGGDAQVNLARGTVVTHAKAIANEMVEFSGPESFHQDDYSIFYNNVKDNVAKRIAAYKANR